MMSEFQSWIAIIMSSATIVAAIAAGVGFVFRGGGHLRAIEGRLDLLNMTLVNLTDRFGDIALRNEETHRSIIKVQAEQAILLQSHSTALAVLQRHSDDVGSRDYSGSEQP